MNINRFRSFIAFASAPILAPSLTDKSGGLLLGLLFLFFFPLFGPCSR